MDKLKAMQLFVAAVDTGSFAAAGESLGLSPPRVTAQIQELEESLGTTLIVRTTRQRRLTDAGKRYYDSCKSILEDISVAELEAQELGAQPKGGYVSVPLWLSAMYWRDWYRNIWLKTRILQWS